MYLTSLASDCTQLRIFRRFPLASASTWLIKATQIRCDGGDDAALVAPDGCTQWHLGNSRGEIKTFNFDGGAHLTDQNQNVCIRLNFQRQILNLSA